MLQKLNKARFCTKQKSNDVQGLQKKINIDFVEKSKQIERESIRSAYQAPYPLRHRDSPTSVRIEQY